MYQYLTNPRGVSLVSVVVAMGILGILIGVVAQLFDYQIKAQRTIDVRTHALDIKLEVLQLLTSRRICELNFASAGAAVNPVTNTPNPSQLIDFAGGPPRLVENEFYKDTGIRVASINLINFQPYSTPPSLDQYKGTVTLDIVLDAGGAVNGPRFLSRQIELAVQLDGFEPPVGADPMTIETCVALGQHIENPWVTKAGGDIYFNGNNVGIGDFGEEQIGADLEVQGRVKANVFAYDSDERLKEKVTTTSGIATVSQLRGVDFRWAINGQPGLGVIAQEVERILPHLVHTDDQGLKSVDYLPLIAPLIEANKELVQRDLELQRRLENLEKQLSQIPTQHKSLAE